MSRLIVQFARAPVEGHVKTRMQPYLSSMQALKLHESLVRICAKKLIAGNVAEVHLWVDGQPEHPLFLSCLEIGVSSVKIQCGLSLGEKMFDCLSKSLCEYRSVLLVGSDCPAIDRWYLLEAFQALESAPLVFGPALDGGYVLIGAREIHPELFEDIVWGGNAVLDKSLEAAKNLGVEFNILNALQDIDRPADLDYYSEYEFIPH